MHHGSRNNIVKLGLFLAVGGVLVAAGCNSGAKKEAEAGGGSTSQTASGTTSAPDSSGSATPPPTPGTTGVTAPPNGAGTTGAATPPSSTGGGAGSSPTPNGSPHVVVNPPTTPPKPTGPRPQADINMAAKVDLPGKMSGPDVDAVRAKIQAQYDKQSMAIAKEDPKLAMAIYDTDWRKVHINNRKSQMNRQEFYFKRLFARLKKLHANTTIRQFSLDGDEAYVVARQHMAARAMSGKLKKEVWTYVDYIVKDDWEKQPNGEWLMVGTTNIRRVKYAPDHLVTVNGKTLPGPSDDNNPAPPPSDADIDAVK